MKDNKQHNTKLEFPAGENPIDTIARFWFWYINPFVNYFQDNLKYKSTNELN